MVVRKLLAWWAVLLALLAGAASVTQFGGGCAGAGPVKLNTQQSHPALPGTQPSPGAASAGGAPAAVVDDETRRQ
jgi:hypothetical protein